MTNKEKKALKAHVYRLQTLSNKELSVVFTEVLNSFCPEAALDLLHQVVSKQTSTFYSREESKVRAEMEMSFDELTPSTRIKLLNRIDSGADWSEVAGYLREAGVAVLKAKKVADGSL